MPFPNTASPPRIVININDPKSAIEAVHIRGMLGQLMVFATLLMVLFCGMFPFDFTLRIVQHFDWSLEQIWSAGDGPENVVFFLPVGFALGAMFWRKGIAPWLAWMAALVISVAMTFTVEISQMHLASRDPSFSDVTCNTIGGLLGFFMFVLIGEWFMRPAIAIVRRIRNTRHIRWLILPAALWTALFLILPVSFSGLGSLASWKLSHPLIIGNEANNVCGWRGLIANLWMADRNLTGEEIDAVLSGKNPLPMLNDRAVAAYAFDGDGPYVDSTGHCDALAWTADHPTAPGDGPIDRSGVLALGRKCEPITWGWWLRTSDSGFSKAADRIVQNDAFTLIADLATADPGQEDRGPRILSLSSGPFNCNLQLVQDHDKLLVRLRTKATGRGGDNPEFVVPYVFEDTDLRRIVITYEHGKLLVANDHSDLRYGMQISPESWLVWRIYPRQGWRFAMDSHGQSLCGLMYRGLALLPLGIILGTIASVLYRRGNLRLPRKIVLICIPIAALLLEAVLLGVCGSPVHITGPVASLTAGLIGVLATGRHAIFPGFRFRLTGPRQ